MRTEDLMMIGDFTFYVDRDYKVLLLFNQWINYIAGEGTSADRHLEGWKSTR